MKSYPGQCLCGAIKYCVDKIEPRMAHCHCRMCRKFHGAAFSTFGEARIENFHWLSGEDYLKSYQAENGTIRQFCSQCGSSMTFRSATNNNEFIEFSLGTLDSDIELRPDAHLFTQSKASWVQLNDSLPQFKKERQ